MRPVGVQPVQDRSDTRPPHSMQSNREAAGPSRERDRGGPGPPPRELWRTATAQSRALCRLRTLTHLATGQGAQGSRRARGDAESSSCVRGRPGRLGSAWSSVPLWLSGHSGHWGHSRPGAAAAVRAGQEEEPAKRKTPGSLRLNAPRGGVAVSGAGSGGCPKGVV